jgi:hypothetical protein
MVMNDMNKYAPKSKRVVCVQGDKVKDNELIEKSWGSH